MINDPLYPVPTDLLFDPPISTVGLNEFWLPYLIGAFEQGIADFDDPNDQFETFLQWLLSGDLVMLPVGTISMIATQSAIPPKWVECNGDLLNRFTYASLFAVIGTTYGAGNGISTFQAPDFRGRTPIGRGDLSPDTRLLGQTIGASTHTLSVAELPSHTHTATVNNTLGTSSSFARGNAASAGGTATTNSNGSGNAHNNMQPSLVVAFMIYAGV